jgi:hypothetical protein
MSDPARPHRALAGLARGVVCAAALVATAAAAPADGPPAATSRDAFRDLQLAVRVRRELREDADLSALNLGVGVRDGVATLWGPVPSADLIPKAVKRAEAVPGVLGVRHEMFVAAPEKKLDLFPLDPEEPLVRQSGFPDSVPGAIGPLTGRDEKAGVAHTAAGPRSPPPSVELGRPVAVSAAATQPAAPPPQEPATAPATTPAAPRKEDLAAAVRRVRGGDPRFRTLRAEVRGSTVTVSAEEERSGDAMALAQLISRLPGVERVVTKSAP